MSIKILIVCETKLISSVIKHAIVNRYCQDLEVVGCAGKVDDARAYVQQGYCNMLLIHSGLRHKNPLTCVKSFSTEYPNLRIIVFDLPKSSPIILTYLENGASGYILHEDSLPRMVRKIKAVHANRPIICPEIIGLLVSRVNELASAHNGSAVNHMLSGLTPREKEVLTLLGENLSNQEIANNLVIEVGTVKNHVHHLLKKLGVHSRHDAAACLSLL